jgi:hypothetical protein
MILPLPGATVEVLDSGYAVIRWQGYATPLPLHPGEWYVFESLNEVRLNVAAIADARTNSSTDQRTERAAAAKRGRRAMAAVAGAGAGAGVP